jgi:hypothetical protein
MASLLAPSMAKDAGGKSAQGLGVIAIPTRLGRGYLHFELELPLEDLP